jgi:hypothetical protein
MPKWLIRYAVTIYPRRIRERYGDEIADLLATSQRPVRDLADVTRCALMDRVTQKPERATMPTTPSRWLDVIKLFLIPTGIQLLSLVPLALLLLALAALEYSFEVTRLLSGMLAGLVAVLVFWLARRAGRRWTLTSPGAVVPAAMSVGLLLWWLLPSIISGDIWFLPHLLPWVGPSIASWCAGMMLLNAATAKLPERVSGLSIGLINVVGGFVVMELCTVVRLITVLNDSTLWAHNALTWYPLRLVGYSYGNAMGYRDTVGEVARGPEALLTLCTVFALTLIAVRRARIRQEVVAEQRLQDAPGLL